MLFLTRASAGALAQWTLLCTIMCGCGEELDGDEARLGEIQQELSNMNNIYTISPPPNPTRDVSAAWIRSSEISLGNIAGGFTTQVGGVDHAAYYQVNSAWGSTTFTPGVTTRRWDQTPVWPTPANFCTVYDCGAGATFVRYETAPKIVWPGLNDAAVLVTTTVAGPGLASRDVALVASQNGGNTYGVSRIISVGESGGGTFITEDSVHATAVVTDDFSSANDGSTSFPVYVVWQGGLPNPRWWMAKVLFDFTGNFVFLAPTANGPIEVPNVPSTATTVTVGAEHLDNGVERTWFYWTTQSAVPVACPSAQRIEVKWFERAVNDLGGPNQEWFNQKQIDKDTNWKPCVGTGAFTRNSERLEWGANQGGSSCIGCIEGVWVHWMTYSKSDPATGNMRIIVRHYHDFKNLGQQGTHVVTLPVVGADRDEYNPELVIHQGNMTWNPLAAIVRNSVIGSSVEVRVATQLVESWWNGTKLNGTLNWVDGGAAPFSGGWTQGAYQGTGLGLGVLQLCVDLTYGTCPGNPAQHPQTHFFASWPRMDPPPGASGQWMQARKFEH